MIYRSKPRSKSSGSDLGPKRLVFIGPRLTANDPAQYEINRARRGELPDRITLRQFVLLAVSNDSGEDYDAALELEGYLDSLKAGLLLKTWRDEEGKEFVTRDAIKDISARLERVGRFGEGPQRWCGVWKGEGAAGELLQGEVAALSGEWLTRSKANERASNEGLCVTATDLFVNAATSKWLEPALHPDRADKRVNWAVLHQLLVSRQKPQVQPQANPTVADVWLRKVG